MTIESVRAVLLWCVVLNFTMLFLWFLVFALAHDWLYRWHSTWFRLSVERFDALHYWGMVHFKIAVILFNIVPCVALFLVG